MEIVKRNMISIICGVVAILAAVAVFVWPLDGYYEQLRTDARARAAVYSKAKGLDNKPRNWPLIGLDQTTPEPLRQFPSQEVIKAGEKARKESEKQSTLVYQEAVKINEQPHKLVVANALPDAPPTVALKFTQNYIEALRQLRTEVLKAGIPPTDDEVKRRAGELWEKMKTEYIYVPGNPTPVNQPQIDAKFKAAEAQLPYVIQNEMATQWKMYVDPNKVFRIPQGLPTKGEMPDPQHIWWCNVEYWVYKDVCDAIAEVNSKSNNVLTSPVKNLLVLDVPWQFFPGQGSSSGINIGGGGAFADPNADPNAMSASGGRPDPTIAVPEGPGISATKRISNNLYDVVHFDLAVDIEATAVPLFLKTLATRRFVSVLELDMDAVDSQALKFDGYVYGDRPVVQIRLRCEALLMREWTIKYMPPGVRKMLGIPDAASMAPRAGL